jgi:hypothetical protein
MTLAGCRHLVGRVLPLAEPFPGNGATAGGDTPCPCRWPDTAVRHATTTIPARHQNMPCHSNAPKNEWARTIARTPSTNKFAADNGSGLAVAARRYHAG